jgi:DNA repair exonuclease SbcCD nuclease subunit
MGFCFIHAADLHLDTPFEGVGAISEDAARKLRDASLSALDRLTDLAVRREAAFVLLAGDLYDGPERGLRAEFRLRDAALRLERHGIPLFAVFGNHDPLDGWGAIREWPANTVFFGSQRVESRPVEREGRRLATIHGISFPTRQVRDNLALKFHRGSEEGLHIGLLHANVGASSAEDSYAPCSIADLAAADMDYWALGHIHTRSEFRAGRGWAVYPGNTQGRSFKPGELGPKGVTVVCVEDGIRTEFEPVDSVRFDEFEADISSCGDIGALLDSLREGALRRSAEAGGREVLLRATLKGRGPLHAELRLAGKLRAVLDTLREDGARLSPQVFWVDLLDSTRSGFERDQLRGRGDFAAELVDTVDRLLADDALLSAFVAAGLQHPKAAAIRRWLNGPSREEERQLILASENAALDSLLARLGEEAE